MLIALACLITVAVLFAGGGRHADADPSALEARALLPYLTGGQALRLADVYPEAWDTAQLVALGETLDPWTWNALRAFDARLAEQVGEKQLLVFWRAGEVARVVRLTWGEPGMPWFDAATEEGEQALWPRREAVFTVTLQQAESAPYYLCTPREPETAV